ncbi:MAG: hypothetical protein M3438_04555 [Pseudomonadota bacterium]|nr:hypothetical protein [Pseudomonadota bacterium]
MKFPRLLTIAAPAALIAGCAHPAPPAAPYHAVSNQGWHLVIDDKHVTFLAGGGQAPILQPRPQPVIGVAGEIYQTQRINVNIVHASCAAAGRTYPDRVQVYVDGVLRNGCGGL